MGLLLIGKKSEKYKGWVKEEHSFDKLIFLVDENLLDFEELLVNGDSFMVFLD